MQRFLLLLRSNWISAAGAIITTLAFMAFVTTFVYLTLHGGAHGPYVGLVAFFVLPTGFVVGLFLIPLGLVIYRAKLRERMDVLRTKPFRLLSVLAVLTLVNLAAVGTGGYEAANYLDSQQFCGTLCHEVMSPTYEAYVDSPHARVTCVECHIGEGASWFVKSKISGMRQVAAVLFDTYQRPIPTPVHNLRPARDTCEHCHWPDKFSGDRLVVRKHYEEDEQNSQTVTVLVLKTGGTRPDGTASGIHWHVHPDNKVEYYSPNGKRDAIPWIRWTDRSGKQHVFTAESYEGGEPPAEELRTMDCIDCHNQPSHAFEAPERALDNAITAGLVSRELPFVRKLGLEALRLGWTRDNVEAGILKHLQDYYGSNGALSDAAKAALEPSAKAIAAIWQRNVHPAMGITWGTYPNFIGHGGCMRCHDGEHMTAEGDAITMECATCHVTLAQREANPEILEKLGLRDQ